MARVSSLKLTTTVVPMCVRAFDKVARILGRSDLNFPKSDLLEIKGPRSKGADEAVAVAVTAANASMLGSSLMFY